MWALSKTYGLLFVLYFIQFSSALYFYINETERKCFIEEVPDETSVVVVFNVELYNSTNGEFMLSTSTRSVLVEVRDPRHTLILSNAYTSGKIFFTTALPGQHVICLSFSDIIRLNTSVLRVHLDIKVGPATINYTEVSLKERLSPIELKVRQLVALAEQIKKEQDFQSEREYQFRQLNDSVRLWILIWCIIQTCLLLVLMGLWNFQHLEDIFKTKKLICVETAEKDKSRPSHEDLAIESFQHSCSTKKEHYTECESCAEKYCNQKCCEEVWKQYHEIHCLQTGLLGHPINHLDEAWKQMHFPPVVLAARIMASVCQSEDPNRTVSVSLQIYHQEVSEGQSAYKSLSEQFVTELKAPQEMILSASSDDVQQRLTPEGLHMLMGLVANSGHDTKLFNGWIKKLSELQMSTDKKQKLDSIIKKLRNTTDTEENNIHVSENLAIIPLLNISEDNCGLNATFTSPNSIFLLSMCSIRDIHTNEEIVFIYPDRNALERSQHERQILLRGKYLFTCFCCECVKPEDITPLRNDADKSHCEDD